MTLASAAPSASRHEVEGLYGKCLLQFQTFELKLKAVVATHRFSGSADRLDDAQATRIGEMRRKTLGALVGEMMGSVVAPLEGEGLPEVDHDVPETDVAFSVHILFPTEELLRIKAEHRDLVALRNSLVHHFLDEHDLRTEEGCLLARQALMSAIERVSRANLDLSVWKTDMERAQKALADLLSSPEVRDCIVTRRTLRSSSKIVQILLDAATELAPGGWASVETAANLIAIRHPDERP